MSLGNLTFFTGGNDNVSSIYPVSVVVPCFGRIIKSDKMSEKKGKTDGTDNLGTREGEVQHSK